MPLIVTPRQLTQRAQFYQQLGQLAAAGIPIPTALDMLMRNPPSRAFREPIRLMIGQLATGATVSDAMQSIGKWIPSFDIALIRAAEHSGRLDVVFKLLANYYDARAALIRQMIGDLAYPVFVFHFAILIFNFIAWFQSGMSVTVFALRVTATLAPIYFAVWLMIFASQGRRGEKWRAFFEAILRRVPLLGTARHYLALSRLAAALEALLNAGVTIIEAWEMAAAASGSPALQRTVLAWKPQLVGGQTPSEAVNAAPRQFPEVFANLYHSGEISGQLDESLERLRTYYHEEGTRKLHLLAKWVPQLIYLCVAGFVAFRVINFYTGYFNQLNEIMK
jgi:type II secretory pathway component PulF